MIYLGALWSVRLQNDFQVKATFHWIVDISRRIPSNSKMMNVVR